MSQHVGLFSGLEFWLHGTDAGWAVGKSRNGIKLVYRHHGTHWGRSNDIHRAFYCIS